ncbi:hypothetical protein H5410_019313 [Solanum commersonii]|uniref:Uncharacterized protein n=1 Tax=Solanum commersonii TaxID=4109 RepID=A0A9J5Z7X5_SOLCO|nr:hypothetical protein H5410_019313 [Solanum commersonii]
MFHFHGQMGHGSSKPLILPIFVCYNSSPSFLVMWNSDLIFAKKFLWTSIKFLPMEPVGLHDRNVLILKVKRSPKQSQLSLTAKTAHFQSQMSPGASKPPILPIFMCYDSLSFLVIWNSDLIFAKKILWTSVKTLAMDPFTIFFGDLEFWPYFCQKISWMSFKTLAMESVGPHGQNNPFSRSNEPESSYGASCLSWLKRPIFNVKRALEQVNPINYRFSCAVHHIFLVILNFDLSIAESLHGRPLIP